MRVVIAWAIVMFVICIIDAAQASEQLMFRVKTWAHIQYSDNKVVDIKEGPIEINGFSCALVRKNSLYSPTQFGLMFTCKVGTGYMSAVSKCDMTAPGSNERTKINLIPSSESLESPVQINIGCETTYTRRN